MPARHRLGGLPVRLLWPTLALVVLVEAAIVLPALGIQRRLLLDGCQRAADVIAAATGLAAPALTADPSFAARLRKLGLDGIWIRTQGAERQVLAPTGARIAAEPIDLTHEPLPLGIVRALRASVAGGGTPIALRAPSQLEPGAELELTVARSKLRSALRDFAWRALLLAAPVAAAAGGVYYWLVFAGLVRPIRRLTAAIAAFHADPDRAWSAGFDPAALGRGEIGDAGRDLADLRQEMRTALWRNARLAALGTTFARACHDLRGSLATGLLSAERLSAHSDPMVARIGAAMVNGIEHAAALVQQSLDYALDAPPAVVRSRCALRALVAEAAQHQMAALDGCQVENRVDPQLAAEADRLMMVRILGNLLRNAVEAGAKRVRVTAGTEADGLAVRIADDGPGLTESARVRLFQPFASSRPQGAGLGLAIARDLMRAQGGEITLAKTGPGGTTFRLVLPRSPGGQPDKEAST